MVNLDDISVFSRYDQEGMFRCLRETPQHFQRAWQEAMGFALPEDYAHVDKVVILGMGGSAVGGELVAGLLAGEAQVPIFIHRDYGSPAFVDGRTLVIASSYSGMTEETLSSFKMATDTGAKVLAITTGGSLRALAEAKNIPVFTINYRGQPRAALPYSLLPILGFMQRLGIARDKTEDVDEAGRRLEELSQRINEGIPLADNPAKQLANGLHGRLPVIYGAGVVSAVARRWKTQINENSKAWAFDETFPELNHNAVVGYQFPPELAGKVMVVMLRPACLPERIQLRYQVTGELLERAGVEYRVIDGEGTGPLSQVMTLVLFGDYVSCYLAMLYQVDPSPVEAIVHLKNRLSNRAQ